MPETPVVRDDPRVTADEPASAAYYDDVEYDPASRRDPDRPKRARPVYTALPLPPGASRARRAVTGTISRLDCLKAALRNFF